MNIDAKILNKILANLIQPHYQKANPLCSSGFYAREAGIIKYMQVIKYDTQGKQNLK